MLQETERIMLWWMVSMEGCVRNALESTQRASSVHLGGDKDEDEEALVASILDRIACHVHVVL